MDIDNFGLGYGHDVPPLLRMDVHFGHNGLALLYEERTAQKMMLTGSDPGHIIRQGHFPAKLCGVIPTLVN